MADTAHKTDAELVEHFDAPEVLKQKAATLVKWIRESKHFVTFTGAGLSTSAGISDFRGPTGVWTRRAQGLGPVSGTSTLCAVPTRSHMSLIELERRGYLKYLISQNTDGLHRRSGFPTEKLSELHGNSNLERCKKCGKEYMRDFRTRSAAKVHEHETGRICDNPTCKGKLHDTIINFGENLPVAPLRRGEQNAEKSDLHLVLGSSLRVTPAADMPATTAERGGRLVICNLQTTPLDGVAAMVVRARTDDLLKLVMEGLELTPPPFKLRRHVIIEQKPSVKQSGKIALKMTGVDADGTPLTFMKSVQCTAAGKSLTCADTDKALFYVDQGCPSAQVKISVQGHYKEPDCLLQVRLGTSEPSVTMMRLSFAPGSDQWDITRCFKPGSVEDMTEKLESLGFSAAEVQGSLASCANEYEAARERLLSKRQGVVVAGAANAAFD